MKNYFYALLLILAINSVAFAELKFTKEIQEVHADGVQKKLDIVFDFKNIGSEPVKIRSIRTNCGCIKATSDKEIYQPDESGKITATFRVGGSGRQQKRIKVLTDQPERKWIELTTIINIPEVVALTPNVLRWHIGETPQPQVVNFKVLKKDPIRIVKAESFRPEISVEWREIEPGKEYQIIAVPKDVSRKQAGIIRIETDQKDPGLRFFSIFYNIFQAEKK